MDAEGLGRKLLLNPPGDPRKPGKADCGYCDGISQNTIPASTLKFELSQCWHSKERLLGPRKRFGSPPAVCPPERPRPFARYRFFVKSDTKLNIFGPTSFCREVPPYSRAYCDPVKTNSTTPTAHISKKNDPYAMKWGAVWRKNP